MNTPPPIDTIPAHHYSQIQHQIMVTGDERCTWFAGDPSARCLMIEVPIDGPFIESLMLKELNFLNDLDAGIEPPLGDNEWKVIEQCSLLASIEMVKSEADQSKGKAVQERWNALKESILATHSHPKIEGYGFRIQRTASGIQCRRVDG